LASISASVDRFLIGRFWGAAPVAIYRQAYQLMTAPTDQLLSPIYQVTQPGLSMLQTDEARYRRFYQKVITIVSIMTMPLSLFVAVYATEITLLVLGPKWAQSAPILLILSFGTFTKQAVGSAAFVLITRGRSRPYLVLMLVNSAAQILLMAAGVRWGTQGVAIADVATTYAMIAPRLYYSFKNSPVTLGTFFAAVGRPAAASVVMAVALILLRLALPALTLPVTVALGCALAAVVFPGAWLVIPGGKAELKALVLDLRSALQQKAVNATSVETPAVAN
ncbi:MAG TPA: oligosaccharide flippase family protein, partial [Verrucomicrobiae bacterium]|nr:oligosaccharide flippase family protein [Verrucomicrobiae bacterium]